MYPPWQSTEQFNHHKQSLVLYLFKLFFISQTPRNHQSYYLLYSYAFSRMSCMWNHYVVLSDGLLPLSYMHLRFIHVFWWLYSNFFLSLNNIPLDGSTIVYLFIYGRISWLLPVWGWIKLLWTCMCKFLCEDKFSNQLGK